VFLNLGQKKVVEKGWGDLRSAWMGRENHLTMKGLRRKV